MPKHQQQQRLKDAGQQSVKVQKKNSTHRYYCLYGSRKKGCCKIIVCYDFQIFVALTDFNPFRCVFYVGVENYCHAMETKL